LHLVHDFLVGSDPCHSDQSNRRGHGANIVF
jgi:hypothetical protein